MGKFDKFRSRHSQATKIVLFLAVFVLSISALSVGNSTYAESLQSMNVSSGIVIEKDSLRVLCGENINRRMEPASTTKILTAITVIENCDLYKIVEIPVEAEGVEGSSIYLKAGEKWRVIDLLFGLMLRSGNDSAVALAIATSGRVIDFVKLMNQTAFKAGAYSSSFSNPHGLSDDKHYTTAYDLALITAYASRNEIFSEICQTKSYHFIIEGENRVFTNKNKLLFSYEGANGFKTGYTKSSGRCLVSGAIRNGMQLIAVVLNEGDMWNKSISMLDYCFEKYSLMRIQEKNQPILINLKGKVNTLAVARDIVYPLSTDEWDSLKIEYILDTGNTNNNAVQGYMMVTLENNLIFSEKLYRI